MITEIFDYICPKSWIIVKLHIQIFFSIKKSLPNFLAIFLSSSVFFSLSSKFFDLGSFLKDQFHLFKTYFFMYLTVKLFSLGLNFVFFIFKIRSSIELSTECFLINPVFKSLSEFCLYDLMSLTFLITLILHKFF